MVTTTTIIEQDGKKVSTGDYSQKYPLEVSRELGGGGVHREIQEPFANLLFLS